MEVKNFVFVKENQSSSQNYSSYYQLTFSESNRLIVSVICLVIHKSYFLFQELQRSQTHEQHEAEELNLKLHRE